MPLMHRDHGGHPYPLADVQECVGPGWASLVEEAYNALPDGSTISQVKEKYGGLRFYAIPAVDAIDAIEARSLTVCEDCGKPGLLTTIDGTPFGWMRTLCDGCRPAGALLIEMGVWL